ncbi:hypothetical protein JCM33374_g5854 [Metschnikowia sp. JCM 33374]|nr:hypothetical protein JCM33374_g5854 [Metschnikowia sp. JCM 33374]
MFGVFGLLNLLIGSVYPVIASFKAYDSYSRLATKTGSTTFNVGGVSIPLGTILKKATTSGNAIEEDTMNYRLLSVQMWLIYWMVNASVCAVENILLLKWLPLYSPLRCALSLWLIAPIIVSSSRLKSSQVLSFNDVQQEWAVFSGQGCGLLYFQYLRPFIEENVGLLSRISLEPLLASISGNFVLPLAEYIGVSALFSGAIANSDSWYTNMLSDYTKRFRSNNEPTVGDINPSLYGDMSEYDVVDKPGASDESEVRSRTYSKQDTVPNEQPRSSATASVKSWFW